MTQMDVTIESKYDFLFAVSHLYPNNVGYVSKHIAFLAYELTQLGYKTAILFVPDAAKLISKTKFEKNIISKRKYLINWAYYSIFNNSFYYNLFYYIYSRLSRNPIDFKIFSKIKLIYNDITSLNETKRVIFNTWEVAHFYSRRFSPNKAFYIVYHNHEHDFPELSNLIQDSYNSGFNIIATTEPVRLRFSLDVKCKMIPAIDPHKINQQPRLENKVHNTLLIQLSKDKIKGADYAILAIQNLLEQNKDILIYTFGDYDFPQEVSERWLHFKNVGDSDLKKLYEKCEIYLSPVVEGGIPGSAAEAMLNGCATITTDVSGAKELIEPGVNGIIIPSKDSYAILTSVQNLISQEEKIKSLGTNAMLIKNRFSIENMTKTFIEAVHFYEQKKY